MIREFDCLNFYQIIIFYFYKKVRFLKKVSDHELSEHSTELISDEPMLIPKVLKVVINEGEISH